jgi:hypothetical protein
MINSDSKTRPEDIGGGGGVFLTVFGERWSEWRGNFLIWHLRELLRSQQFNVIPFMSDTLIDVEQRQASIHTGASKIELR